MKVLFVTYPWAFHVPGGGEEQIMRYREFLPSFGIEPLLFDPWRPQFSEVDLVHYFSTIGGSVHFCGYAKSLGLPLVVSSSLWITRSTLDRYPVEEIRDQLSLAEAVLPNSKIEADNLSELLRLPRAKFRPIYNGVDPRFAASANCASAGQEISSRPYILNVGNIEPRKNQLNLARACRNLGMSLVLIGRVRDRSYFNSVIAEGGELLRHAGWLDNHDPTLRAAYASCSAFVLPSTCETPGLAALEAAAAGARVVVTREGSTREYFGDLVDYVDPNSIDDISAGIKRALARSPSQALRDRVLTAYSWRVVVADLADLYRSTADRAGIPAPEQR